MWSAVYSVSRFSSISPQPPRVRAFGASQGPFVSSGSAIWYYQESSRESSEERRYAVAKDSDDAHLLETQILVQRAQEGNGLALNELFARYLPRTRQIVAFRMGWRFRQLEEHEDMVQEALLKVFRGLHTFDGNSEGSFRNWVARCVENVLRDHLRRSATQKRGAGKVRVVSEISDDLLKFVPARSATASAIFSAEELQAKIEGELLALSERQREVVLLRRFCGMSYEEITRDMGFANADAARQMCARAMRKLKAKLDQ